MRILVILTQGVLHDITRLDPSSEKHFEENLNSCVLVCRAVLLLLGFRPYTKSRGRGMDWQQFVGAAS